MQSYANEMAFLLNPHIQKAFALSAHKGAMFFEFFDVVLVNSVFEHGDLWFNPKPVRTDPRRTCLESDQGLSKIFQTPAIWHQ